MFMSLNSFKYQMLPSTIYNKKKIKKMYHVQLHCITYAIVLKNVLASPQSMKLSYKHVT